MQTRVPTGTGGFAGPGILRWLAAKKFAGGLATLVPGLLRGPRRYRGLALL